MRLSIWGGQADDGATEQTDSHRRRRHRRPDRALGLAQKGFRSILLEEASALGEIGAGIQLGPNTFHAFGCLGVGEAVRRMAVY